MTDIFAFFITVLKKLSEQKIEVIGIVWVTCVCAAMWIIGILREPISKILTIIVKNKFPIKEDKEEKHKLKIDAKYTDLLVDKFVLYNTTKKNNNDVFYTSFSGIEFMPIVFVVNKKQFYDMLLERINIQRALHERFTFSFVQITQANIYFSECIIYITKDILEDNNISVRMIFSNTPKCSVVRGLYAAIEKEINMSGKKSIILKKDNDCRATKGNSAQKPKDLRIVLKKFKKLIDDANI